MYYAYLWRDPKNNIPRYVGKGHGNRVWAHIERPCNAHYSRLLLKRFRESYVCLPTIFWCKSEAEAFELERFLIKEIGRLDLGKGPLLNLTDGGFGGSGVVQSQERILKRVIGIKAAFARPDVNAKFRANLKAALADPVAKARQRAASKKSAANPETQAKRSASLKAHGRTHSRRRNEQHRSSTLGPALMYERNVVRASRRRLPLQRQRRVV